MFRIRHLVFALLFALSLPAAARSIEVEVNGLVCAFCAQGIAKRLKAFDATQDVFVSLEHRRVALALKPGQDVTDAELTAAITDAGYTPVHIERSDTPLADIRARIEAGPQ